MEDSFWEFSLSVYSSPEAARACLFLQDRFGVDVNLLLVAAYQGRIGDSLSGDDIRKLADLVRDWQELVIRPVRQARRAIKYVAERYAPIEQAQAKVLRENVKSIELECERLEQHLIFGWITANRPQGIIRGTQTTIRDNLLRVLRHFSAEEGAEELASLSEASMSWRRV